MDSLERLTRVEHVAKAYEQHEAADFALAAMHALPPLGDETPESADWLAMRHVRSQDAQHFRARAQWHATMALLEP